MSSSGTGGGSNHSPNSTGKKDRNDAGTPTKKASKKSGSSKANNLLLKKVQDGGQSLLVVVLDVSPVVWGEHDLQRTASDKKRLSAGKPSLGPTTLEELLRSLFVLIGSFYTLESRQSAVVIIGVAAAHHVACLFPRKDVLETYFRNQGDPPLSHALVDMKKHIQEGVAELVAKCAAANHTRSQQAAMASDGCKEKASSVASSDGCMAAGISMALAIVNRFLVANQRGVSALTDTGLFRLHSGVTDEVAGLTATNAQRLSNHRTTQQHWSPRLLVIQASPDRPQDYNAIMNAVFCSKKLGITWDACFLMGLPGRHTVTDSAFLQQACDLLGGLYMCPKGRTGVGQFLTEVLMSVFLPSTSSRELLNLPAIQQVDFRAQAFDTGKLVDQAFVCNQCLSIFKNCPPEYCFTCGAQIKRSENPGAEGTGSDQNGNGKRRRVES